MVAHTQQSSRMTAAAHVDRKHDPGSVWHPNMPRRGAWELSRGRQPKDISVSRLSKQIDGFPLFSLRFSGERAHKNMWYRG